MQTWTSLINIYYSLFLLYHLKDVTNELLVEQHASTMNN